MSSGEPQSASYPGVSALCFDSSSAPKRVEESGSGVRAGGGLGGGGFDGLVADTAGAVNAFSCASHENGSGSCGLDGGRMGAMKVTAGAAGAVVSCVPVSLPGT